MLTLQTVFDTRSGKRIDILNPDPSQIIIEDIAGALGKICRFGGQSSKFYSVAQHSCIVAALAPEDIRLEALLHDAAEAYLGDVIKPLKNVVGISYTEIEDRFMTALCEVFNMDKDRMKDIKFYDNSIFDVERDYLQLGNEERWDKYMSSIGMIRSLWQWEQAERLFLHYFNKYKR